jgi:hypothetical protein
LLDRETLWYETNERIVAANRILDDSVFGSQADLAKPIVVPSGEES